MSQRNVEAVIGRLVTDEGFRRRFAEDSRRTLRDLTEHGMELNSCELSALAAIDPAVIGRLAEAIDPRLQKADAGATIGACSSRVKRSPPTGFPTR